MSKQHSTNGALPRYDQALLAAKRTKARIMLHLAVATEFATECIVSCTIHDVDKYSVLIETHSGRNIWVPKAWIVGTEIMPETAQ